MKIAITGHTQGLGRAIYEHFAGHEVIGFSRSNDFMLPSRYDEVVEQVKGVDLFFNNFHVDDLQIRFLKDLADAKCAVVTSGSMAANYTHSQYCLDKKALEDFYIAKETRIAYANRSLLLKMGYLPNRNRDNKFLQIDYQTILDGIDFWLSHRRCTMLEFANVLKD